MNVFFFSSPSCLLSRGSPTLAGVQPMWGTWEGPGLSSSVCLEQSCCFLGLASPNLGIEHDKTGWLTGIRFGV